MLVRRSTEKFPNQKRCEDVDDRPGTSSFEVRYPTRHERRPERLDGFVPHPLRSKENLVEGLSILPIENVGEPRGHLLIAFVRHAESR